MSGRPFTEEQNKWIKRNYKKYGKHHIAEAFNKKFNDCRTMAVLWSKVRRMGLTGNGAEYKALMCKKHFERPIGSEHKATNGYTLVKVKDDKNGKSKNWKTKESVIWEQHYGKIPKGKFVMFLDGNIENFDLDNLALVDRGIVGTLNKKDWRSTDPVLTQAGINWCELYRLTGDRALYTDDTLCVYDRGN